MKKWTIIIWLWQENPRHEYLDFEKTVYVVGKKNTWGKKKRKFKFLNTENLFVNKLIQFSVFGDISVLPCMDHTKSLKREHKLHNIVVPEFRYIRASRVVSRGRDFNTLPNRTFVPFVSVAQNVCCLSLLRGMVRLSQLDRGRAIALILQGRSQLDVAQQFGVHESTISPLVQRRRATGRLTDRPRSGRPRVTTQRQDRRTRLVHLRNRLRTATETAREVIGTHGRRVCPRTVRNRLREFDLRPRRPYVGPNLTPRRRQRRMQWLRSHAP